MSNKRKQLELAATESVQRSGLQSLSFRTLADKIGIKSSSVHYYFPEKSDLATVLIENYTLDFNGKLIEIDQRETDDKSKLIAFIGIFEEVIKADKFCLCGMMAAEMAVLDKSNKEKLRHYFELAENWLAEIFERNQHRLTVDLTPEQLAKVVMSGLEGAILIDRVDGSHDRLNAQAALISNLIK